MGHRSIFAKSVGFSRGAHYADAGALICLCHGINTQSGTPTKTDSGPVLRIRDSEGQLKVVELHVISYSCLIKNKLYNHQLGAQTTSRLNIQTSSPLLVGTRNTSRSVWI